MVTYEEVDNDIYKTTSKKSKLIHPLSELKKQQLLINSMLSLIVDVSMGYINAGTVGQAKDIIKTIKGDR